jgi:NADP-dependent 3-hydroxy acid dehydrogenase YdfG
MSQIALITGATAGIGEAVALRLAGGDFHTLILTGRRKDRLDRIARAVKEDYDTHCITLCFDIRDRAAVQAAWDSLPPEHQQVDLLVNNAGLALDKSPIHAGNPDDWDTMIDTNLKGLLYITRLVTPGMVERRKGHVVNIGSIAGRETYPGGNVYSATKFAVEGLSRSMRIDLAPHRVRVTSISPGLVETEFSIVRFKGDTEAAAKVYQGFEPLVARDIAEAVWFAVNQQPHVNINDINLTCTAQPSAAFLYKDEG